MKPSRLVLGIHPLEVIRRDTTSLISLQLTAVISKMYEYRSTMRRLFSSQIIRRSAEAVGPSPGRRLPA